MDTERRSFRIASGFTEGVSLPSFTDKQIKDEPMFFSADPVFAWKEGGPITRAFLAAYFGITLAHYAEWELRASKLPGFCFDSRVHMLMPGWFPCIPGWHHDDVPRSRSDGQPNYHTPEFRSQHCLALINGDICPTEFAVGEGVYTETPLFSTHPLYKVWHNLVESDIDFGVMRRVPVPSNKLIHFNWNSFHQGTRAVKGGWRWFGRLSWDAGYEKGRPKHNEIRRQVQVYLEFPMEGW